MVPPVPVVASYPAPVVTSASSHPVFEASQGMYLAAEHEAATPTGPGTTAYHKPSLGTGLLVVGVGLSAVGLAAVNSAWQQSRSGQEVSLGTGSVVRQQEVCVGSTSSITASGAISSL